jgi:hypothetical protein
VSGTLQGRYRDVTVVLPVTAVCKQGKNLLCVTVVLSDFKECYRNVEWTLQVMLQVPVTAVCKQGRRLLCTSQVTFSVTEVLQWCYNGVKEALQSCYRSVAAFVLQRCYRSVAVCLQYCCIGFAHTKVISRNFKLGYVTIVLQQCNSSVTGVLQQCYSSVTVLTPLSETSFRVQGTPPVLQECYMSAGVLQECYRSVAHVLQECYRSLLQEQ